jgi:hypothetical protein
MPVATTKPLPLSRVKNLTVIALVGMELANSVTVAAQDRKEFGFEAVEQGWRRRSEQSGALTK